MKVLITGALGQVGWELQQTQPKQAEVTALTRAELDISNIDQIQDIMSNNSYDWVINAAAYTAVDKAEEESELAFKINHLGAFNLATVCQKNQVKMLQISTDFVFDGTQNKPYLYNDATNPLSVYGASKQKGDDAVVDLLGKDCCILRTSWVYSSHGNNFVKTMIRLMNDRSELNVVADQIGTPTWANSLSSALWRLIDVDTSGINHWSDYGIASWYDFAIAIYEEASALGLVKNKCDINPIRTDQYPVLATRPQFSVLDKEATISKLGIKPNHWRVSLRLMLLDLKTHSEN